MRKRWKQLALAGLLVAGLGYGSYSYLLASTNQDYDPLVRQAFKGAAHVFSYAQYVETSQTLQGGTMTIVGEYLVDDSNRRYASYSTTTYRQSTGVPIVFQLENRSLDSSVYVRLLTRSPLAKLSVPSNGAWQHFPANTIPTEYRNIAVAGPVIDDLKLLGGGGKYLIQDTNPGTTSLDDSDLIRYTFKLSRLAELADDGGIRTIARRVGKDGLVDMWIDSRSAEVARMRLRDGVSYTSTTTFSRINEQLDIRAPASQ